MLYDSLDVLPNLLLSLLKVLCSTLFESLLECNERVPSNQGIVSTRSRNY